MNIYILHQILLHIDVLQMNFYYNNVIQYILLLFLGLQIHIVKILSLNEIIYYLMNTLKIQNYFLIDINEIYVIMLLIMLP